MAEEMNLAELEKIRDRGERILTCLPSFKSPKASEELGIVLETLREEEERRLEKAKTPQGREALEGAYGWARYEARWEYGENRVLGLVDGAVQKEMASFRQERYDPTRAEKKEIWLVEGQEVSRSKAEQAAATSLLEKEDEVLQPLARVINSVNQKEKKGKPLSPEDRGAFHAAHLFYHAGGARIILSQRAGVSRGIKTALQEFEAQHDDLAGLDSQPTEEKTGDLLRHLPGPSRFANLAEAEDVAKGLSGKQTTPFRQELAGAMIQTAKDITGKEPTVADFTTREGLNLEKAVEEKLKQIVVPRGQRIMSKFSAKGETNLEEAYRDGLISSEGFEQVLSKVFVAEGEKAKEINERLGVYKAEISGEIDRKRWGEDLRIWRRWTREGLPMFQANITNAYGEVTKVVEGKIRLLPYPETIVAVLNNREVREAIVRFYPLVREGKIAFGSSLAVYGVKNPDNPTEGLELLEKVPESTKKRLGITGDLEETIAFEVLRTWLVHPEPRRAKKGEPKRAWDYCFGPFNSVRFWYFLDKWPIWTEKFTGIMKKADKLRVNELKKWKKDPKNRGKEAPKWLSREVPLDRIAGINDLWTATGRPIEDLLNKWDEVKRDPELTDLAGIYYDSALKATLTAKAIETLFRSGITPENVYKLLYEDEKFKHLSNEERMLFWNAFYDESYDVFLRDLREKAEINEGLKVGTRRVIEEKLDEYLAKGLITREKAHQIRRELRGIPEKGEGFQWRWRTRRYLWRYPSGGILPFVIIGKVASAVGIEAGEKLDYWARRLFGSSFYGAAIGGIPFFWINLWPLLKTVPIHLAIPQAIGRTLITAAWPAAWTASGLLHSSGLWMAAASWGCEYLGKGLGRFTKTFEELWRENKEIQAARKK